MRKKMNKRTEQIVGFVVMALIFYVIPAAIYFARQ